MTRKASNRLAVIGAGSWGTALAISLASRFSEVQLWARSEIQAMSLARQRENQRYLAGFRFPEKLAVTSQLAQAFDGAGIVLLAVPSAHFRHTVESLRPHLAPGSCVVSATKGIEEDSLCRMSQVIAEVLGNTPAAVLSGPTFAREIAAGEPAAVVIAAHDPALATYIQQAFSTSELRFYTSSDVTGVEIGGALKNVIAIASGLCRGLGLGSNSVAALITRGLAEITRLASTLGAHPRTLSGLTGLGDLVLTATGDLSRNRFVGLQLGQGRALSEILAGMTMVAEGVGTCRAAWQLGQKFAVDLPIVNKMYEILYAAKDPRHAIRELMDRPLTNE